MLKFCRFAVPLIFATTVSLASHGEGTAKPEGVAGPGNTASAAEANLPGATGIRSVAFSSSSALPSAPSASLSSGEAPEAAMENSYQGVGNVRTTSVKPFSALGVAVKFGVEGIGFDLATPLGRKFNLRGGASFFSYSTTITEDGININPNLKFRKAGASLDFYPWAGSFRISPGLVFYNGNHADATAQVPGNGTFTLNDVQYYSSPTDPVHGTASILFGNKAAPSFTVGWGNMIPRHGGHWSVPFELGFEYIGQPKFVYNLAGTACSTQFGGCMNVATSPDIQSNLQAEQNDLNNDISGLRFYPILSIGLGYKF